MQLLLRAAAADAREELTCHSFLMRFTLTGGEGFGPVRIKEKSEKGEPVRKIKKQEEEDPDFFFFFFFVWTESQTHSTHTVNTSRASCHTFHGLAVCLRLKAVQVRAHRNPLSNSFLCFV